MLRCLLVALTLVVCSGCAASGGGPPCAPHAVQLPPVRYDLAPGDMIFSTNLLRPGRIALYRLARAGPPTHAAIVWQHSDGRVGLLECIEVHGVVFTDLAVLGSDWRSSPVARRVRGPLAPDVLRAFTGWGERQLGKPFAGYAAVIRPAFGLPHVRLRREADLEADAWHCSELVAAATLVIGHADPRINPRFTDPEDLQANDLLDLSDGWYAAETLGEP